MSDELDQLIDGTYEGDDLAKKLRSKIKELQKERDEYAEKFAAFEKKERTASLQTTLQNKGLNPKIAAFVPEEAAASSEALDEWLGEFGDVFGGQPQAPAVENTADAEAINRMNSVEQGAIAQSPPQDIMARIEGAENMDELMAVLRDS
jgi:seryl-tRNA synthetase